MTCSKDRHSQYRVSHSLGVMQTIMTEFFHLQRRKVSLYPVGKQITIMGQNQKQKLCSWFYREVLTVMNWNFLMLKVLIKALEQTCFYKWNFVPMGKFNLFPPFAPPDKLKPSFFTFLQHLKKMKKKYLAIWSICSISQKNALQIEILNDNKKENFCEM